MTSTNFRQIAKRFAKTPGPRFHDVAPVHDLINEKRGYTTPIMSARLLAERAELDGDGRGFREV